MGVWIGSGDVGVCAYITLQCVITTEKREILSVAHSVNIPTLEARRVRDNRGGTSKCAHPHWRNSAKVRQTEGL